MIAEGARVRNIRRSSLRMVLAVVMPCLFAGCSPSIHDAIARGNIEVAAALLEADPNQLNARDGKQKTPFHAAVTYKQVTALELLFEHGADLNSQDVTGMTPLHVAAMLGRGAEAKWLLEHGAAPNLFDSYGDAPLHTAVVFGHGHIIGLLRRFGVDPHAPNEQGETPSEIAGRYRQERVARYLAQLPD